MSNNARIGRRDFLKGSAAALAAIGILGEEALAAKRKSPNVILINADDLGYGDLGCYGSKTIRTPNLDALAQQGVRFTDFYSGASVCTPSRAALLTGRYPLRSGLRYVLFPNDKIGMPDSEMTVAQILKKQGYATACMGKWHLGSLPQFLPTRHGFDYYYGVPYSNDMWGAQGLPLMQNEEVIEQATHIETLSERYADQTIQFAKQNKNQPFFVYLATAMPHKPLYASTRFKGESNNGIYGDAVEEIDWNVGRIMAYLKESGQEKNTLLMFTSDNGPVLKPGVVAGSARPLNGGKGSTWEGGQREPFIARWPERIKPGGVCREVASMLDILPTLANLAGTKAPTDRIIDGRNIAPLLTGRKLPEFPLFYDVTGSVPAVRMGRWKLRTGNDSKPLPEPELYDLQMDIGEKHNVAKEHPDIVAKLQKKITEFKKTLPPVSD